ncbi:MAG: 5'-methylthioadenosine/adenosylhomocysteine nucleosidase [Clostridiales bacterium]|jgi:adenosylhomocysteine nucleosidase|nr:5'-methylthioadenosine/adenosylhomocysteine nucleosidase [Clostridiales bacterium]
MVGVIGAMQIETDGLIQKMSGGGIKNIGGFSFRYGRLFGKDLVVCRCGIGIAASSAAAALMAAEFSGAEPIINIGVAGGTKPGIRQGDIVLAERVVQHDYDLTPDGLKRGQIGGFNEVGFACSAPDCDAMEGALKSLGFTYYRGVIASGDQFINDSAKARRIFDDFGAYACDMESAAVGHICALFNRRFFSMRAISDNGDHAAIGDFYSFVKSAAERSICAIEKFITA